MQFEIEGTLVKIKDPQSFPSGFVKREFVVRTDEMYPQEVMFELFKDKISLIESYQVNEQIKVSFNIRGREWEGKHFTNLQVSSALSPCRLPVFRSSSSAPCDAVNPRHTSQYRAAKRARCSLQAWRVERVSGDKQLADQAEALDLSEWEGYGSSNMTPKASAPPPAASPARKSPAPPKAQVQWDDDIPF